MPSHDDDYPFGTSPNAKTERNKALYARYCNGETVAQLARAYDMTGERVRYLIRKIERRSQRLDAATLH